MMRKRLIILAAALGCLFIGFNAHAQTYVSGMEGGVCCNHGTPAIPAGQQCLLLHQVGPGENLHILSAYYYGDARGWRRIYNLNKETIKNPNKIMAGQVIKIEVPPCWTPRFPLQEFMRIEERRIQLLKRGPGEKAMEYRQKVDVETKVKVIIEEEEEVEEGRGEGAPPLPTIITPPETEPPEPPAATGEEASEE